MSIRGVVLDIDGTLVRGRQPLIGAVKALKVLCQAGYRLVFCTQENQLSDREITDRLIAVGLPVAEEEVVSAGTVSVEFLSKSHRESPIYVMGSKSLRDRLVQSGMTVLSDEEGENATVVLVGTDPDVNLIRLSAAAEAVRRGAVFYVTNLDRGYPLEDRIIPSAGSLALAVAYTAERRPLVLGKPSQTMAAAVLHRLALPPTSIVVIGDQPAQDVRLGRALGASTILVLSGVTTPDVAKRISSRNQADAVLPSIQELPAWLDQHHVKQE